MPGLVKNHDHAARFERVGPLWKAIEANKAEDDVDCFWFQMVILAGGFAGKDACYY